MLWFRVSQLSCDVRAPCSLCVQASPMLLWSAGPALLEGGAACHPRPSEFSMWIWG